LEKLPNNPFLFNAPRTKEKVEEKREEENMWIYRACGTNQKELESNMFLKKSVSVHLNADIR